MNSNEHLQPIYQIDAITHRDNAIWPFVPEGRPVDEYHTVTGISWSAMALNLLRNAGLPVTAAFAPMEMANFWLVVTVPEDWRARTGLSSPHFTYQIADVIWKSSLTWHFPEIFVMDDDIDPSNIADVNWAIPSRTHPGERRIEKDGLVLELLSSYTDKEKAAMKGVHIAHDCLFPDPRPEISSFAGTYPEEIQQRVLARWDEQ